MTNEKNFYTVEDFLAFSSCSHEQKEIFAVIGDPIAHTLSPAMHNCAFQELGMNAKYIAVHVKPDELEKFVNSAKARLFGFNITVPHKSAIIPFLDSIDTEAKKTKSVNTVTIRNGKMHGDSTDGYGLEMALKENFGISPAGKNFLLLGAGGSSRAIAFHLLFKGLSRLFIVNRSFNRAADLVQDLQKEFGNERIEFCLLDDHSRLREFIAGADIIIQSSSLGLKDNDPSPLPEGCFVPGKPCYDTIYKPTSFLKLAAEKSCPCANGLSMLLHQGVRSFEIWTGITPPIELMRKTLLTVKNS